MWDATHRTSDEENMDWSPPTKHHRTHCKALDTPNLGSVITYINAVQNRACRVFWGLGRYVPNAGVQGAMCWVLPFHRQWLSIS